MSFSSIVRGLLKGEATKRLPAKKLAAFRNYALTLEVLEARNLLDAGLLAGPEEMPGVYEDSSWETSVVDPSYSMYDTTYSQSMSEPVSYSTNPEDGSGLGDFTSDGSYSGTGGTSPSDYSGYNYIDLSSFEITAISPDLGQSNNDFVTSTGQLTVLGKGSANSSFQLVIDSVDTVNVTVDANGNWSVALPKALTEGTHTIASQTDGYYYAMQYVMIDLTAPEISLTAPEFSTKAEAAVTVKMNSEGDYLPPNHFSIDVDLDGDGKYTSAGELDFYQDYFFPGEQQVIVPKLPEGTFQLRARLEDGAGNTSYSTTATMQVDPNAGIIGSQVLLDLFRDYQELIGGGGNYGGTDYPGSPPGGFGDSGEYPSGDGDWGSTSDGDSNSQGPNLEELKSRYSEQYLRFDAQDRVGVNVRATLTKHVDALKKDLVDKLKMEVVWVEMAQNMVTGYLPIDQIMALEQLDNFSAVTPLYQPILKTGSVDGQADAPILADVFRTQFGATGQGIKVGVLSDSVNAVGGGLGSSASSGDLPSNVQVLQDFSGGTDEGRAMLEIIHDIAPSASLAFHSAFISPQNFANGILALQAAGSKVINDDVGYLNQPFFNDGVVSQAADLATARGSIYASAAGNSGDMGWTSGFNGTSGTIGSGGTTVTGTFLDLGGGDILQDFTLAVGESGTLIFQWSSAYLEGGSPLANFQVNTDFDVYVTNAAGTSILATFNTNNLNVDEALELVVFLNNGSFGTNNFALAFQLRTGPSPARLRWINLGNDIQAQQQGGPTVWGQPAAKTALAVGAVPWFDPTTPEFFTSLGGNMEFFFDAAGTPLGSPEIRFKPDVSAPDGLNTTFFGVDIPQDPDSLPNFFGTSAATPVAAGAIALLLSQAEGDYTAKEVTRHLKKTALDIGIPGDDGFAGAGLIQLVPLPKKPVFTDETVLNDTSDRATNLGTLLGTTSQTGLTIFRHNNGLFDYDWYQFTAGTTGTLTINLSNIQTFGGGDLHFRLFVLEGGVLHEIGSSRIIGGVETQSLTVSVTAGQQLLLWVYGFNFEQGSYDMDITLT